ncbi:unnamed protein product [Prorocentrum cordatum]|uniref:Uncharacterized protein n=1 Tax=Prorocentrum cordatum TaxID=2364126 RepID=A0ABN9RDZ8_9DINO|nr:unnamed protein product [Polarella glacialis]
MSYSSCELFASMRLSMLVRPPAGTSTLPILAALARRAPCPTLAMRTSNRGQSRPFQPCEEAKDREEDDGGEDAEEEGEEAGGGEEDDDKGVRLAPAVT